MILAGCGNYSAHQQTMLLMGTYATIKVLPDTPANCDTMLQAFQKLQRYERIFNNYDEQSQLSQLNRMAVNRPVNPGPDLWRVIQSAQKLAEVTNGAFDITAASLKRERGYQTIILDADQKTVMIADPEAAIDLGGIATGYAMDRCVDYLRQQGIKDFFIDIGGDVYVSGTNRWGKAWQVGIRDPYDSNKIIRKLALTDKSITTSGNYVKQHIIDPRTGNVAQGTVLSVSVIADTGIDADALATAFYVMGVERTRSFLQTRVDLRVIFVVEGDKGVEVVEM